jgi:hypothetical protein
MKQRKNGIPLFAVCINNSGYPASLELHKIYRVMPDENAAADGDLRIVDESGEDYLYSAKRFIVLDLPQALKRALVAAPKTVGKAARKKPTARQTVRA